MYMAKRYFDWDPLKNTKLIEQRSVSFEMVVACIEQDQILDRIDHPNQQKYPGQQMYILELNGYVHVVPFVEDDVKIFLKTIFPSRTLHRKFFPDDYEA